MLSRLMERRGLAVLLLAGLSVVTHGRSRRPYLVKTAMSWLDARQYCRQGDDGDLATMLDQSQLQQLLVAAQGSSAPQVWIGLYQDQPRWQWSSGDEVTYYNWNRTYFCAKVNAEGTWEDAVCDDLNYFMCSTDSSQGSRTYTLIKQSKTWAAARDHCRQQHTDLVTISSPRENQAVRKTARGSVFWIGLFNQPWEWSDGGDSSFRLWAPGDPDNQNRTELCVSVTGPSVIVSPSVWYDMNCLTALSFLCCDGDVFWIGLFNEPWEWSDGGDSSFRNWTTGEPNNMGGNEKCVLLSLSSPSRGALIDKNCGRAFPFLCLGDARDIVLVKENRSWEEALDYCRTHHTDLTSLLSQTEQDLAALEVEGARSPHVWLGLSLVSPETPRQSLTAAASLQAQAGGLGSSGTLGAVTLVPSAGPGSVLQPIGDAAFSMRVRFGTVQQSSYCAQQEVQREVRGPSPAFLSRGQKLLSHAGHSSGTSCSLETRLPNGRPRGQIQAVPVPPRLSPHVPTQPLPFGIRPPRPALPARGRVPPARLQERGGGVGPEEEPAGGSGLGDSFQVHGGKQGPPS
nr:PREDICTED: macrophage mannose receptor 1-like [Lepisosteus oculatus]